MTQTFLISNPLNVNPRQEQLVFWCDGLSDLLEARAWLCQMPRQGQYTVVGPVGTKAVFEMDSTSVNCIEQPDWLPDLRPGWFNNRKLDAWVKSWDAGHQNIRVLFRVKPSKVLVNCFVRLGFDMQRVQPLDTDNPVPCLMAGPSALAISTHYYRAYPPNSLKLLVVIHFDGLAEQQLGDFVGKLNVALPEQYSLAERLKLDLQITYLAAGQLSKVVRRELQRHWPTLLVGGVRTLIGHIAYADKVMGRGQVLTRLCQQMCKEPPNLL